MTRNQWLTIATIAAMLAVATLGGLWKLSAVIFESGQRLGAVETKVDGLVETVKQIAPPTVRIGGVEVPLTVPPSAFAAASMTASRQP